MEKNDIYLVNTLMQEKQKNFIIVVYKDREMNEDLARKIIRSTYSKYYKLDKVVPVTIRHIYLLDDGYICYCKSNMIYEGLKNIIYYDNFLKKWILEVSDEPNYKPIVHINNKYKINILLMDSKMINLFKDEEKLNSICNFFKNKFFVNECKVTMNTTDIKDIIDIEDENNSNTYYILLFNNKIDIDNVFHVYSQFTYRKRYFMYLLSNNLIREITISENEIKISGESYDCTRYKDSNDRSSSK